GVEWRRGRRPLRALREDDLERVAGANVLLRRADSGFVVGTGWRALREPAAAVPGGKAGRGPGEEPRDLVAVAPDHLRGVLDVVETDQDVGDEEAALRQTGALLRKLDGGLEPRRVVVGEVADDRLAAGFGFREIAGM